MTLDVVLCILNVRQQTNVDLTGIYSTCSTTASGGTVEAGSGGTQWTVEMQPVAPLTTSAFIVDSSNSSSSTTPWREHAVTMYPVHHVRLLGCFRSGVRRCSRRTTSITNSRRTSPPTVCAIPVCVNCTRSPTHNPLYIFCTFFALESELNDSSGRSGRMSRIVPIIFLLFCFFADHMV